MMRYMFYEQLATNDNAFAIKLCRFVSGKFDDNILVTKKNHFRATAVLQALQH